MKPFKQLFLFILLFVYIQPILAQTQDKSALTVDRIFNSMDFMGERSGQMRFIEDGKYYTSLEPSKETPGGRDIVKYETETGIREVMVPAKSFIPEGQNRPLPISNYIWSMDHKLLLIYTNTARVWRQNTRGDYYLLDLQTNKLLKLGGMQNLLL